MRGAALAWLLALGLVATAGCDRTPAEQVTAQPHAYPATPSRCAAPPATPAHDGDVLETPDRLAVLLRLPRNFRPDVVHPLIIVYAAAGMTPTASERLTGFTPAGTRAGYVVAYAQHIRPSLGAVRKLAKVSATVRARVCVDPARVYVTGHSDGGSTATALAVLPDTTASVSGLAPSAAGFNAQDFAAYTCPSPRPVLVWHGATDRLFPGWGREAAAWWAACNGCAKDSPPTRDGDCLRYAGCTRPVHYCEGDYGHVTWPPRGAARTISFFDAIETSP